MPETEHNIGANALVRCVCGGVVSRSVEMPDGRIELCCADCLWLVRTLVEMERELVEAEAAELRGADVEHIELLTREMRELDDYIDRLVRAG